MAIRDENSKLTSDTVSLLYFEHAGHESEIHEIILDSSGSIVDPYCILQKIFHIRIEKQTW